MITKYKQKYYYTLHPKLFTSKQTKKTPPLSPPMQEKFPGPHRRAEWYVQAPLAAARRPSPAPPTPAEGTADGARADGTSGIVTCELWLLPCLHLQPAFCFRPGMHGRWACPHLDDEKKGRHPRRF